MTLDRFFYEYPIFRLEQISRYKAGNGSLKKTHIQQMLQYYLRRKRIISIRRGLFAVVPPGQSAEELYIDPYVLAAVTTEDSILSYHTALELHGFAYSVFQQQTFKTRHKVKPFHDRDNFLQPVIHRKFMDNARLIEEFTFIVNRNGIAVRLTTLASTYVDMLDRPDLSGGWEEVYRSLDNIAILPTHDVIRYCLEMKSPILCAKVGYFLERRTGVFVIDPDLLNPLTTQRPKSPYYLAGHSDDPCQYIKKWNLMIPKNHLTNAWKEPADDL